jgi:hypothetical protein
MTTLINLKKTTNNTQTDCSKKNTILYHDEIQRNFTNV